MSVKTLHWEPLAVVVVGTVLAKLFETRYRFVSPEIGVTAFIIALVLALVILLLSANRNWQGYESIAILVFCAFLTFVAITATGNVVSFALIHRGSEVDGLRLIGTVIWVWVMNVLTFAVWYWALDRGGPHGRDTLDRGSLDLLFQAMTVPELEGWKPTFITYIFFSFCTSTAFSPTDTVPLTDRAKLLMMAQALISLTVITVVASRAIGLLS